MTKPPPSPNEPLTRSASPSKGGPTASSGQRVRSRGSLTERTKFGGSAKPKKSPQAMAASVLIHFVVAVIMLQLLTFGHGISSFLDFGKFRSQKEERVTFINTEPKKPAPAPITKPVANRATPQVANPNPNAISTSPVEAPSGNPAPPSRADTGSGGRTTGTGNGVGAIDPNLRGVKPDFSDPRVWQGPVGNGVAPGRNGAERLDSIMGYAITSARDSLDSLARAQGKYDRKPGDWTKTDKDGNKWGWDGTGIRLGKVVIPNALLGLLPLNAQRGMSGNFTEMDREKRLAQSRSDIQRMSERALGDKEFRMLANELRDRRERERRDRLKAPSATVAPSPATTPPNRN